MSEDVLKIHRGGGLLDGGPFSERVQSGRAIEKVMGKVKIAQKEIRLIFWGGGEEIFESCVPENFSVRELCWSINATQTKNEVFP